MLKRDDLSAIMSDHYLHITERTITIRVTPTLFYKVIRAINHWINHIIEHYSDIHQNINSTHTWYVKWTSLYKLMRSSKCTILEMYHIWTGNYSKTYISAYAFLLELLNDIPILRMCYDITDIEEGKVNEDHFDLELALYFPLMEANTFSALGSDIEFTPFTDNQSLTTWNTKTTIHSDDETQQEVKLPETIAITTGGDLKDPDPTDTNSPPSKECATGAINTTPSDETVSKNKNQDVNPYQKENSPVVSKFTEDSNISLSANEYEQTIKDIQTHQQSTKALYLRGSNLNEKLYTK